MARLIPNPWLFLEATGQVFRGDSATCSSRSERSDLSYVGHLRGYHDITEVDQPRPRRVVRPRAHVGIVDAGPGQLTTQLFGVDATLRWRPLQRAIYHSFVGRTELIWSRREQLDGDCRRRSAIYASAATTSSRGAGSPARRYDRSDRADDASLRDTGGSLLSDLLAERVQPGARPVPAHATTPTASTANEFLFQFQFSIGAHGAHPF